MLYTRKGDSGTTKLFGCTERISKSAPRVEALGALDELNSYIGFCRALAFSTKLDDVREALLTIQEDMFVLQASLAGAGKALAASRVVYLESLISRVELEIDPIHAFTIPGATPLSGALDVSRTIARRAERLVIALGDENARALIPYLNRLSSVLFAFARLVSHRAGIEEKAPHY